MKISRMGCTLELFFILFACCKQSLSQLSHQAPTKLRTQTSRILEIKKTKKDLSNEIRSKSGLRDEKKCDIAIGLGSDIHGERGQFALINSIIRNYEDDSRILCIFSFSTESEFQVHLDHTKCVFDDLPANVRIIVNKMQPRETWEPRIFTKNGSNRADLNSSYNWFRWYLKPEHIQGVKKLLWLDTDTIVQANITELYDLDLNGKVAAAGTYDIEMRKSLCFDNGKGHSELNKLVMEYRGNKYKPQNLPHHLNAGVLLIDLDEFQKRGILEEWHRLLLLHEDPSTKCIWKLSNQPPFTLAIRNEYEEFPDVWNIGCLGCFSQLRDYEGDACKDGKILHWNGKMKPWSKEKVYNERKKKYEGGGCRSTWKQYDILSKKSKKQCIAKLQKPVTK